MFDSNEFIFFFGYYDNIWKWEPKVDYRYINNQNIASSFYIYIKKLIVTFKCIEINKMQSPSKCNLFLIFNYHALFINCVMNWVDNAN